MAGRASVCTVAFTDGDTARGRSTLAAHFRTSTGTITVTGTNVTWTASGGSVGPFQYVILYNTSTSPNTKPLIGYWDYSSALTLADGDSFTVKFNNGASSGTILTVA